VELSRIRSRARTLALRAGLRRYQTEPWTAEEWRWGYSSGHLDYFAGIDELPRYSLLIGYLVFLGGEPDIIDIGCGQGLFRERIEHLPFRRYIGVDSSADAIARARRLDDERTTFIEGDVAALADDLPRFDVAVCNEVLSVAPDPDLVLATVRSLLRPGGHLLTSTWRHPGDRQLLRLIDRRLTPVDAVDARNTANRIATRGWRVTMHRR
jgi:2-polyprenyl-6-hydroxyphenyl methylase/3-demethylubiquinone-9 3-methyltransferase